jgi:hypothetical protein
MLDTERQFFEENREDLLRKFPGKFVVVKEHQVLGGFQSIQEALGAGGREYGRVPFLVRRTDQAPESVAIPALNLGILRADTSLTNSGTSSDS